MKILKYYLSMPVKTMLEMKYFNFQQVNKQLWMEESETKWVNSNCIS